MRNALERLSDGLRGDFSETFKLSPGRMRFPNNQTLRSVWKPER